MPIIIEVKADTNDADYITKRTEITWEKVEKFKPLIEKIKEFSKEHPYVHNWPDHQYGTASNGSPAELYSEIDSEIVNEFSEEYCPYGEIGIHTIKTITVTEFDIIAEEKLL